MTATYTFDVFSSLDGYAAASSGWSGYWGKQGPELLDHRLDLYSSDQRMVFGATTYREFTRMLASSREGTTCAIRGSRGCGTRRPRWCRPRWRSRSTGRTRSSSAGKQST